MEKSDVPKLTIEERVSRLEGRLGWGTFKDLSLDNKVSLISTFVMVLALFFSYKSLGLPNHFYQPVLGILITFILYHKRSLLRPENWYFFFIYLLNAFALTLILKLFIGTGKRFPLSWLMYPGIGKSSESAGNWKDYVPSFSLKWFPSPMAEWSIDVTTLQTFLLLLTLIAAVFKFQPFASMIAFLLILFSIPALVEFNWAWVFPAILLCGIGFYLQSRDYNTP